MIESQRSRHKRALTNVRSQINTEPPDSYIRKFYERNHQKQFKSIDVVREKQIEFQNNMLLRKILSLKRRRVKKRKRNIFSLNYYKRVKEQERINRENVKFMETLK